MTNEPNGVKWTDIAIVILTGGIVIAAVAQTVIFSKQRSEMHNAGAQTDRIICAAQKIESDLEAANAQNLDALKKTLAQSQSATNASNSQSQKVLDATIEQTRLDQRAFVNFGKVMQSNPVLVPGQKSIEQWEFRPLVGNSGDTPTRGAIARASFLYIPAQLPSNFTFPDLGTPTPDSAFILGPKEQDVTGPLLSIPDTVLQAVKNKTTHLYFWGWLKYRDVFSGTPEHMSMLCIELTDVRGQLLPGTQYQFGWSLCPRHNCGDNDCKGEPYGSPTKIWPN